MYVYKKVGLNLEEKEKHLTCCVPGWPKCESFL